VCHLLHLWLRLPLEGCLKSRKKFYLATTMRGRTCARRARMTSSSSFDPGGQGGQKKVKKQRRMAEERALPPHPCKKGLSRRGSRIRKEKKQGNTEEADIGNVILIIFKYISEGKRTIWTILKGKLFLGRVIYRICVNAVGQGLKETSPERSCKNTVRAPSYPPSSLEHWVKKGSKITEGTLTVQRSFPHSSKRFYETG